QRAEQDDSEWAVRRSAMPLKIRGAAAHRRDDVDIGRIRGQHERGGCAPSCAAQTGASKRDGEQRVCEVVHGVAPPVWVVGNIPVMSRCRWGALLVLVTVSVLVPAPASAWGFAAHKFIMGRAIDLLPAEIRPFFAEHRD